MKWGCVLLLAFSIPARLCYAQDAPPATPPAAPAAPAGDAPAAAPNAAPVTAPVTDPAGAPATAPVTAPVTDPANAPATAPVTTPVTDPVIPVTAPVTVPDVAKPDLPPTGLPVDESYIIGPTDGITVTVLKETTLSSTLLVRPDGMITMPLLGDVKAVGLTPLQLAADISTKLKKYIQDPNVSVTLTQINSKKVYLMGEVNKVGPVDLTPNMTLLEAIADATGLTLYANTKKMYILRNEDGKHTKIRVQYKAALKGNSELNLTLKPGDTIVVP